MVYQSAEHARALAATAATLASTRGNVVLAAGNDLTLSAAQETHSTSTDTYTKKHGFLSSQTNTTHDASSDTYAIGTTVSGDNVVLSAGHDLTTQAAQLTADNALSVSAGHDVDFQAGEQSHSEEHDSSVKKSSFINTSARRFGSVDPESYSHQESHSSEQTWSIGSTLSGDTVTVGAGHDLSGTAVQIAGTHDVMLAAGHDLVLTAGQDTYTQTDGADTSRTGLMNGGGFSVLIGNRTTKTDNRVSDVSYTGSLVGSTDGAVTLSAGNDVHITGSDVLSQTGTAIVGKNVTIDAAVGSTDTLQKQSLHTGGITVGVGGAAAQAASAVYSDARRGSQVSDSRLKSLYAAKAAYEAKDLAGLNAQAFQAAGKDNAKGINLKVGIGGSTASSQTTTHDETTYGSSIRSLGDVTIAATGGDLNVIGSTVSGDNVALAATHDINVLSQAESHTLKSDNKNASGGIGLQIGTDGIGFYAEASVGKGNAHGNGTTHTESHIDAANTLTLVSGNDTTIQGAQLTGDTVLANIGHDLNVISEQDTDDYASKQWQVGGKVVVGMGASVSGYASYGKANSHYASVDEASGIQAGSGGYQIHVGDTTHLVGGQLASTADASNNLLDTGNLIAESLQNVSKYDAMQVSVSGGSGGGGFSGGMTAQNHDDSSTTQSGVAAGTVIVRDHPGQDLGDLNLAQTTLDGNGIANSFDQQKVAEQQELGQVAGYVGMRTVGGIADYMANHASSEAEQKSWSDGGANKVLLHGLAGAAIAAIGGGNATQGALGAAASEAASGAMQDYLLSHNINPNSDQGKLLMGLASTAIGGVAGGANGAGTALQGESYNRQLHESEKERIRELANGDPQKEADLTAAACALVHCSAEYAPDSQEYAYYSKVEALGNEPQYADDRALLQQQTYTRIGISADGTPMPTTEVLYQYDALDRTADNLSYVNNSYGHPFTRAGGALQAIGGGVSAATGYGVATVGVGACVETAGGGCTAAAGGVLLGAWGVDQAQAGARTVWNGSPTQTFGGQAIQDAFGISPVAAELLYGAVGGVGEAYAGLALLPAGSKASAAINADGTLTLTGDSSSLNAVSDFEQMTKGTPATPTPGGYLNQAKVCGSQCVVNITDANDQALAASIAQNGDPTGELTESLVNSVAQKQGMTVLDGGKYAGNKGFDAVLQNADGSVTILIDAKQMTNGTFSLGKTADDSLQLSAKWIDQVMDNIDKTSPAYKAIEQARFNNALNTAVIGVNKQTGKLIGVPINVPSPH